jgi:hypothetical protein
MISARTVLLSAFVAACAWPVRAQAVGEKLPEEDAPFDVSQYPLMTLAKAEAKDPCKKGKLNYELKDKLFSTELVYQGGVRQAPAAHYELLRHWTKNIGDPGAVVRYKKQVSFSEGKKVVWLSLPEGLIDTLAEDFQVGDRALLYTVFVGCSGHKPLFSVDEYDTYEPEDQEAEDYITRIDLKRTGRAG